MRRVPRAFVQTGVTLVAAGFLLAAYLTFGWPRLIKWGATEDDVRRSIPMAQHTPPPRYRSTRVIEIHAPPSVVWSWLVQIGQGRGGFYSYSWLENLVGANIHNARHIQIGLQHLAVGDTVRLAPTGFLGGRFDQLSQVQVAAIEPGRLLVLRGWGTFVLDSVSGGETRLVVREETPLPAGRGRAALLKLAWEPAHFVMERQMLRGIRDRAENRRQLPWASGVATLGFLAMALTIADLVLRRRGWRFSLLWPLAGAATVWLTTGDTHAALAGFVGTGTVIAAIAFAGRMWWKWIGPIVGGVWLVLLLAGDAYLTLGWLLGAASLLALMTTLKRPPAAGVIPT